MDNNQRPHVSAPLVAPPMGVAIRAAQPAPDLLDPLRTVIVGGQEEQAGSSFNRNVLAIDLDHPAAGLNQAIVLCPDCVDDVEHPARAADRKSTRLNSSH